MARLFAGNTLASFGRSSTGVVESTAAGSYDSEFVPGSIVVPGASSGAYAVTAAFTAATTAYLHFEFYSSTATANISILWAEFVNSSGVTVGRLYSVSNTQFRFDYWNGSSFVNGTSITYPTSTTRFRFDVKIICGASGSYEIYNNSTSIGSGAIGSASCNNIAQVKLYGPMNANCYYSQVMIADYDLRDSRYKMDTISGTSASNTAGSGAYTDINESVLDESTAASVTASGDKRGFTHTGITVPSGYIIGAMVVNARGRATGAVTDGKLGVRQGGTNYSSAGRTYNGGYEPRTHILDNDPATATNFTQAGFNSAEVYIEAV